MSRIFEIGRTITGKTPSTKNEENWGEDVSFYSPEDIANGYVLDDAIRHISNKGFETIKNNTIDGISVLVGCIGSDMGNVAVVSGKCAFNQQINAITEFKSDVNPFYVYYYLSTRKAYLRQLAGSTATPLLPKSDFEQIDIPMVDKAVQDAIVKILKPIDDKIKLNKSICSDLEALAKEIYDYWFVQFDFPDDNGMPYKSSGGKMVWSDELNREIPEGWEIKTINDIATLETSSIWPLNDTDYHHYSIPAFDESKLPALECGSAIDSNKYVVPKNCVLVSKLNPQFKRIWLVYVPQENSICSTEFLPLKAKENLEYLYGIVNTAAYSTHLKNKASSSTGSRKRIDPENCMSFLFAHNDNVARQYKLYVHDILKKFTDVPSENQQLANLRDFLLPMLMNGQIKIEA